MSSITVDSSRRPPHTKFILAILVERLCWLCVASGTTDSHVTFVFFAFGIVLVDVGVIVGSRTNNSIPQLSGGFLTLQNLLTVNISTSAMGSWRRFRGVFWLSFQIRDKIHGRWRWVLGSLLASILLLRWDKKCSMHLKCQLTMHTSRLHFLKDRCNSYCFSYFWEYAMIVDMMKHFYVFRNCQMSASSCDGVVAIVFLWDAVCIGLGGSFRMPNPINIDVEFDLVLAAKSEFGY